MTSSSSDDHTTSPRLTMNRKATQPIPIPHHSFAHRPTTKKRSATVPIVAAPAAASTEYGRTTVEQLETAVLASLRPVGDITSSAQFILPLRDECSTPTPYSSAGVDHRSLDNLPPGAEELESLRIEGTDTPRALSPASPSLLSPLESPLHSSPESGTLRLLEQYKESEVENRRSAMQPSPVIEHPTLVDEGNKEGEGVGESTSDSEIAIFVEEGSSSFDDVDSESSSDEVGLDVDVETHAKYLGFDGEGFGDCDDVQEDEDETSQEETKQEREPETPPPRHHHHHHHKHKRWHPPTPPDPDFLSPTGEFTRSPFIAVATHRIPPRLRGAIVTPGVLGKALGLDLSVGGGTDWTSSTTSVNGRGSARRLDSGSDEKSVDVERGRSHIVRPLGSGESGGEGSPRRSKDKGRTRTRTKRESILRPRMVSVGSG